MSQQKNIGVLKAMGFSKKRIILHYLSFSLIAGLIGSTLGAIISVYLAFEITHMYTGYLGIPFTIIKINYNVILEAITIGMITCFIGAIIPCLTILKFKPADILRPYLSTIMIKSRKTLFEKIIDKIRPPSIRTRISIRNLFRNRIRTTTTILGVAFSLMLVLSMTILMDSFVDNINIQYEKHIRWDIRARFSTMKNISELNVIKEWAGVDDAEPFIYGYVSLQFGERKVDSVLIALLPNTTMHRLNTIHDTYLMDDAIIIGKSIASNLDVWRNDVVNISCYYNSLKLEIIDIDEEPLMLHAVFTTLKTAQKLFKAQNLANGVLLKVDKSRISEIRKKLYELANIERVDVKLEIKKEYADVLSEFTVFNYVMMIIATIVAFSLVLTTITINVLERKYEVVSLRIIGIKARTMYKLITIENLLMMSLGLILGTILGYLLAKFLIIIFVQATSEAFMLISLAFKPATYFSSILLLLATIPISQIPSMRYISRLNLAQTLKEAVL